MRLLNTGWLHLKNERDCQEILNLCRVVCAFSTWQWCHDDIETPFPFIIFTFTALKLVLVEYSNIQGEHSTQKCIKTFLLSQRCRLNVNLDFSDPVCSVKSRWVHAVQIENTTTVMSTRFSYLLESTASSKQSLPWTGLFPRTKVCLKCVSLAQQNLKFSKSF